MLIKNRAFDLGVSGPVTGSLRKQRKNLGVNRVIFSIIPDCPEIPGFSLDAVVYKPFDSGHVATFLYRFRTGRQRCHFRLSNRN